MAHRIYLSKPRAKFLDKITEGLTHPAHGDGSARKFNNAPDTFMPLSVERLGENHYSVGHYFEQNGDLVPDPDLEFVRDSSGRWSVVAATMATGHYTRVAEFDDNGVTGFRPRALASVRPLANLLLDNAKRQQGL